MKNLGFVMMFMGIALMTIGGIGLYHQYVLLMDYCFNPVGYRLISLNRTKVVLEIDLQIKNKSAINVAITGYDFDIYVNGNYATKVKSKLDAKTGQPLNQVLKGGGLSILTMVIEFDPQKVFKAVGNVTAITQIIAKPEEMIIGFDGKVSVDVEGISVKGFSYKDEYPLKEMLPDKDNPSPPCK